MLERADFRSERADSRPERADFRPERADFRPERADSRPERADFRPERADFSPGRAWAAGRTDGRTDERTNESPPVFYRTLSPSGPLPKKLENERFRYLGECWGGSWVGWGLDAPAHPSATIL